MKTILRLFMCYVCMGSALQLSAQDADSLGLPGDNLDLAGVLQLFKDSRSVEEFEKAINDEANGVSNLDLNEDGDVDYIRVEDHLEETSHALILQVPVNENESQDVAVIALEKTGENEARCEVIGDELLYGKDFVIEPVENGAGPGRSPVVGVVVNVWLWPCVSFIYMPVYAIWISPWHWHYYPMWYHPWHPHPWHVWHPGVGHYHVNCHRTTVVHVHVAHRVYQTNRTESRVVVQRTAVRNPARVQAGTPPRRGEKGARKPSSGVERQGTNKKPGGSGSPSKTPRPAGGGNKTRGSGKGRH